MSEALRDLVVSLSLQTDNFTRNIRSVNKQIQEAESKFRLAAAGVENFEATATGLSSKLSTLQQRLLLQENAVGQYERALTAANAKLQECYTRQNDYAARLQTAREAQSALKQQVAAAAEQVRHYSATLGENDSVTIAARGNLDLLKEGYRLSCQEVKKLSGQNTALQKTTQNAADAVSQANTNLNNARAGVKATQAEIDRCSKALALAQTNWDDANTTIKASTATITTFGKEINLAESRFRLAAAGIKDIEKSVPGLSAKLTMLNEKMGLQERQVDQYAIALDAARAKLIAAQQANDPQAIQAATNEVIDAEAALNDARAALESTRAEIQRTNQQLNTARSAWTRLGESLDTFGDKMQKSGQLLTSAGRALTTTITTPIAALGAVAIKSSISFESAFASVRKTVDATEDEFASLSAEVKQMSTEVATSADDIAEVMAVAGQLGIATEHLSEFTRTMVDLGNSTDIVAAEAASTLAKFANITSMDQSQFGNLGATLVDLGNNYATTESAIMEMSLRLAAAGHQVGLSEAQILGFATALSAVGIEAQMGGSAFSKALVKMEVAAATGGQALTDFATICGMSEEQFIQMWNADPAAVFQAFIEGLASMDDEGMSAIAVLNEIGISEVRLRDTLLRSVNATELFANTQATATAAWNENVALTEEAGKRYATTASQLTNLKNKAILFGQQIGDDLNPVIKDLISGANDMLDSFLEMDEAQRMQIIQFAGFAAAIGPVLLLVGKLHTGIGKAATGIGKFATAVGKAGGGAKGFFSVLSKSPSFWLAIAAAAITATVAIIDYASGAKMAREAMEGMNKTADEWKNNAAETFYGNSEGLSFFGMSADDFARDAGNMQTWLDGLLRVWSDGEKETNEIVTHWTDSFKSMTAATRSELEALKETADAGGYTTVSESLAADIATLDAIDAEVEKLLKKRQNGHFTEKDQKRLQELIDMRGAIEIKYNLTAADPDGFDTIRRKVDAEVARAQARGQSDASVTVYQNAMVASAEGMAAVNAKLDEQYDKEYQVIMLMEDGAEKQAALDDLNTRYLADRRAAALEYAETLAGIVMPVWNQEDIQQTNNDVARLIQLMREYSAADEADKPAILEEMNQLTAGMDEGALVEYVGILMQIQSLLDSGMTEDDLKLLFPEIDFTTALDQIAAIQAFLNNRPGVLPGLEVMFGEALPEEVLRMTQYTYDCLLCRYTKVTLGTAETSLEGSLISASQIASGSIGGGKLSLGSIGTGHIQHASIGSMQVKTAAIGSAHIQQAAIGQAHIQEAAIGTAQIEDASITKAKIADAAIDSAHIGEAVIGSAHIQDAAIQSAHIEEAAINAAHIGEAQIQTGHIHDAAITHAKIGDAAIDTANIRDAAIDTAKIANAAITSAHIAGAAIGSAHIQEAAITTGKIMDAAITRAKIAELAVSSAQIDNLAVTAAKIADAAITNAHISNAAVDTAQIALGAITAALIENGAVGTAQIADASITEAKVVSLNADVITSGTLATERLIIKGNDGLIYEINAQASGLSMTELSDEKYRSQLNGSVIVARSITADQIAAATITANEILAGSITGDRIAAATIEGSKIKAGTLTTAHVTSDFASTLDLTSNVGINQRVETIYTDMDNLLGYRVEVLSTTDILSNAVKNTTLSARVWHGSEDMTDKLPASRFNWKRVSADTTADALWNASHRGMKSIQLTVLDVQYSATYQCDLTDS